MRYRAGLRIVVACLVLMLVVGGLARAAPGPGRGVRAAAEALALEWWTIDGGGGNSAGPTYTLSGTLGQFDAGPGSEGMTGGGFQVTGGFWGDSSGVLVGAPEPLTSRVYVPLIMRE
jgi:hypothetical protein